MCVCVCVCVFLFVPLPLCPQGKISHNIERETEFSKVRYESFVEEKHLLSLPEI